MRTPDEYRKIAVAYYRLAREAKTEADRLALLDLAQSWLEAALREDTKSAARSTLVNRIPFSIERCSKPCKASSPPARAPAC